MFFQEGHYSTHASRCQGNRPSQLAGRRVFDPDGHIVPDCHHAIFKIFKIGEIVENLNTGLVGRIIRRGTNYLICVTEDNIMFKSWIKDVNEAVVNGTEKGGVPADQRLVGTDSHRKYVESMVPGSSWGLQFINKYRKK